MMLLEFGEYLDLCPMDFEIPLNCDDLASKYSLKIIGNSGAPISGMNEIHLVRSGDLTFVDHPKYYAKALQSAATFILIDSETDCPEGKVLLVCDSPFDLYNAIARAQRPPLFWKCEKGNHGISTHIGEGTQIALSAVIGNHVFIGKNCFIHPNVVIYDHSVLGDRVEVHANTVIGGDAFYYKRKPMGMEKMYSCGRVVIEDDVEIGCGTTIDRGVSGDTRIGKGTKVDNQVQIGHDTVIGQNCVIGSQCGISGVTVIEDNVTLWGQVGVNKDIVIGAGAVVLGQSGVTKSIEGGKVYLDTPARESRKVLRELATLIQLTEERRR